MSASPINLHSASTRFTATVAGKLLTCLYRPLSGGTLPPGKYKLSAPMHNSVYGTFALLSAAGSPLGSAAHAGWIDKGWIQKGWIDKGWIDKGWIDKGWITRDWVSLEVEQPGVYVVVGAPLSGRSGILVTGGFAELMAALQRSGGATVTVA